MNDWGVLGETQPPFFGDKLSHIISCVISIYLQVFVAFYRRSVGHWPRRKSGTDRIWSLDGHHQISTTTMVHRDCHYKQEKTLATLLNRISVDYLWLLFCTIKYRFVQVCLTGDYFITHRAFSLSPATHDRLHHCTFVFSNGCVSKPKRIWSDPICFGIVQHQWFLGSRSSSTRAT